jgi:hypothetical protein
MEGEQGDEEVVAGKIGRHGQKVASNHLRSNHKWAGSGGARAIARITPLAESERNGMSPAAKGECEGGEAS